MQRAKREAQLATLYGSGLHDPVISLSHRRKLAAQHRLNNNATLGNQTSVNSSKRPHGERSPRQRRKGVKTREHLKPWYFGNENQTTFSGSQPLAVVSRYGPSGTMKMVKRAQTAFCEPTFPADACQDEEAFPPLPGTLQEEGSHMSNRLVRSAVRDHNIFLHLQRSIEMHGRRLPAPLRTRSSTSLGTRRPWDIDNTIETERPWTSPSSSFLGCRPSLQDVAFKGGVAVLVSRPELKRGTAEVQLEQKETQQRQVGAVKWSLLWQLHRFINGPPLGGVSKVPPGGRGSLSVKEKALQGVHDLARNCALNQNTIPTNANSSASAASNSSYARGKAKCLTLAQFIAAVALRPGGLGNAELARLFQFFEVHAGCGYMNWVHLVVSLRVLCLPQERPFDKLMGMFDMYSEACSMAAAGAGGDLGPATDSGTFFPEKIPPTLRGTGFLFSVPSSDAAERHAIYVMWKHGFSLELENIMKNTDRRKVPRGKETENGISNAAPVSDVGSTRYKNSIHTYNSVSDTCSTYNSKGRSVSEEEFEECLEKFPSLVARFGELAALRIGNRKQSYTQTPAKNNTTVGAKKSLNSAKKGMRGTGSVRNLLLTS